MALNKRAGIETKRAKIAYNDYLAMPMIERSLANLVEKYQRIQKEWETLENPEESAPFIPTLSYHTIQGWSQKFAWQDRIEAYETQIAMERAAKQEQARKAAMESGLALEYERVRVLKDLAAKLAEDLAEPEKVWLKDKKTIRPDDRTIELVQLQKFNHQLFDQFRGILNDLAQETGGRKKQFVHGGDPENPLYTMDQFTEDLLAARQKAEDWEAQAYAEFDASESGDDSEAESG